MMILSRIWYLILGFLLAAAFYVVSLAVGQYNRRNQAAMDETLKADSQVVGWALQIDARRRLDVLLLAAVDPGVTKAIRGANGKEKIPAQSKEDGVKALKTFEEKVDKLAADFKSDVLFVTDREGRIVAQTGYDAINAFPEFELGGYPAVFDALHGFFRDDTWVWDGRIARVVARPVEDEVGQPPLGAVVALKWVDKGFAKQLGARTRTNLAFFALGHHVASAATTEGLDENSLEALGGDLKSVAQDKSFKETGRTDVRPLGTEDKGGVLFVRLPGDGWELGAGFAVARPKVTVSSPLGFVQGADDQDKRNVKLWVVALLILGVPLVGILFSFLEHSLPMREMARQAARLKRGEVDTLHLPQFRGGYRPIASDINDGIQRVVEKGGGTARKPADLESILGPVPAQPNMSAFSFPMNDGSAATGGGPPPRGPGAVLPTPPPAPRPPPPAPGSRPGPPPSVPSFGQAQDQTMAMPNAPMPMPPVTPASGARPPPAPPIPTPAPGLPPGFTPAMAAQKLSKEEEEQTMVAQPSADLINAAGGSEQATEWKNVYEEFLKTKRECGEPTDGLTFEKFQQTLKKNRDALMQRHGCKRVKFSVYVKEGRASLKATPVRD